MHWPLWEYCKSGKQEIRNTEAKVYAQYSHAQIPVSCLSKIFSFGLILIAKYYEYANNLPQKKNNITICMYSFDL
jgi:hypothetical protein